MPSLIIHLAPFVRIMNNIFDNLFAKHRQTFCQAPFLFGWGQIWSAGDLLCWRRDTERRDIERFFINLQCSGQTITLIYFNFFGLLVRELLCHYIPNSQQVFFLLMEKWPKHKRQPHGDILGSKKSPLEMGHPCEHLTYLPSLGVDSLQLEELLQITYFLKKFQWQDFQLCMYLHPISLSTFWDFHLLTYSPLPVSLWWTIPTILNLFLHGWPSENESMKVTRSSEDHLRLENCQQLGKKRCSEYRKLSTW